MFYERMAHENSSIGSVETIRAVRLRELIEKDGLSEISRRVGRASTQISGISRGLRPFGERLARMLEKDLGLPEGYFDGLERREDESVNVAPCGNLDYDAVILINKEDASQFPDVNRSKSVIIPSRGLAVDFAIILNDAAMSPEFKVGDIIYFQKTNKAEPGSYVLADVDGSIEFRQLVSRSYKTFTLVANNKIYPDISSDQAEIRIVAKLVAMYRKVV